MHKVLEFETLRERLDKERAGRNVVLCHGVFDLLHIGHIRYLRQAAQKGGLLVVTVTPDRYVDKGPGRPAFTERLRAEALASLSFVDYVAVNRWPTAENTILALRPDFYAKGAEFRNLGDDPTGKIALEAAAANQVGTELVFVEDIVFSSSNLINKYLDIYPEDLRQYLDQVRRRYDLNFVLSFIDLMRQLKVLVVGDVIIDQYDYCSPLGLSSKDPTLALKRLSSECFPGGASAVARHAAGLSGQVTFYTFFGRGCPYQELVRDSLPDHLKMIHREIPDRSTVRKLRYVDSYSLAKMLEIYDLKDEPLPEDFEKDFIKGLEEIIDDYDVVLAADFGHGTISPALIRVLERQARFLAVNTQANAGNRGFHTIFRYGRADFISLARHELSLAFQDRRTPELEHMMELARRLHAPLVMVSCGSSGAKILGREFFQTPALAARVVDRVGAGDALFAIAGLAAALKCPEELIGLYGNIAGARLVEMVGNNQGLSASQVKKSLIAMLK